MPSCIFGYYGHAEGNVIRLYLEKHRLRKFDANSGDALQWVLCVSANGRLVEVFTDL